MAGLGIFLAAIALADGIAGGLSGDMIRGRMFPAIAAAAVVALAGAVAFDSGFYGTLLLALLVTYAASGWLFGRSKSTLLPRLAWDSLALFGVLTGGVVVLGRQWANAPRTGITQLLTSLPYPLSPGADATQLVLIVGVGLFLTTTSNAIVRTVLHAAGTRVKRSEERLRGGRLIGVLERWLIFGLAMAGELTAAAFIISAKSLLRFPELSRAAAEGSTDAATNRKGAGAAADPPGSGPGDAPRGPAEVDFVTEYFLLGSLVSWTLALAPVLLFLRTREP